MTRSPLKLVEPSNLSRFGRHRAAAAERAALELASALAKQAKDAAGRAEALFATASGSDPSPRRIALEAALVSLTITRDLAAEVLAELDRYNAE